MTLGIRLALLASFVIVWFSDASKLEAEESITAYFRNDSVNGLLISDAYETHNMGIVYSKDDNFLSLDLGIVSPDMHTYKNQYRVANRSFGEIVTLALGSKNERKNKYENKYSVSIKWAGQFGIDEMQDFMHRILGLQPVNQVNELVRMPKKTWIGVGGDIRYVAPKNLSTFFSQVGTNYYFGTDRIELSPYVYKTFNEKNYNLTSELGLRSILFDEIVTAEPISADHRFLIPYAEFGVTFEYLGFEWYLRDRFSMPTIKSDDSLYGVLSAGILYRL